MFTGLAEAGAQIVVNDVLPPAAARPLPATGCASTRASTSSAAPTTASST